MTDIDIEGHQIMAQIKKSIMIIMVDSSPKMPS